MVGYRPGMRMVADLMGQNSTPDILNAGEQGGLQPLVLPDLHRHSCDGIDVSQKLVADSTKGH